MHIHSLIGEHSQMRGSSVHSKRLGLKTGEPIIPSSTRLSYSMKSLAFVHSEGGSLLVAVSISPHC